MADQLLHPLWYRTRHQVFGVAGYLLVFGGVMPIPALSLQGATVCAIPGAIAATVAHGYAKRRYETLHDLDVDGQPRDWSRYEPGGDMY